MPRVARAGTSSSAQRAALVGPVEQREHAVAGVLGTRAAVPQQHAVDEPVVRVELMTPVRIAMSAEQFGGADDVGEQHGLEHSFVDGNTRPTAHEVEDCRTPARHRGARAVPAGSALNSAPGMAAANAAAASNGAIRSPCRARTRVGARMEPRIARTSISKSACHSHARHRRAGACPLIPPVEVAESRYVGYLAEEHLGQCPFTPMIFDVFR